MSVAILRMPHGLDYSLNLNKLNGAGPRLGQINNAFDNTNDDFRDDMWNANSHGRCDSLKKLNLTKFSVFQLPKASKPYRNPQLPTTLR